MKLDQLFDPVRFARLLRADLFSSARSLAVGFAATFGVLLVLDVAAVAVGEGNNFHAAFYPLALMVGGHVVTSLAFRDLHAPQRGYMFLTLPGSALEKFVSRLLLTSVGWTVAVTVLFVLFSFAAAGLTDLIVGRSSPFFDPFTTGALTVMRVYLVTSSITLLGAVYFRKLHLVKTVLSVSVLLILLLVITATAARIAFAPYLEGGLFVQSGWGFEPYGLQSRLEPLLHRAGVAGSILWWWLTAPFFWVAGYFRLRDTEV